MKIIRYTTLFISIILLGGIMFGNKALAYGDCSQYGFLASYDYLSGACKCMSGYGFKKGIFGDTSCVSLDTICSDSLGYGGKYNSLRDACECRYGYTLHNGACQLGSSFCSTSYGYNSTYNSSQDTCECSYGYVLYNGTCQQGSTVCSLKYGYHSEYSSLANTCSCGTGYTMGSSGQCVEKQNNVYFFLKELDTENRQAIIRSEYDSQYYKVSYNTGCYSSSFTRYLGKKIVVNLGTDFDLDTFDKIVLQDDDEVCDISSRERVDSTATLVPEPNASSAYPLAVCPAGQTRIGGSCYSYDVGCIVSFGNNAKWSSGFNSNGQYTCNCQTGYQWSLDGASCASTQPTTSQNTTTTPASINENSTSNLLVPEVKNEQPLQGAYIPKKKNPVLIAKMLGLILLQVQAHGEAWYVNPIDSIRYYMPNGIAAYNMMRSYGTGIATKDLNKIPLVSSSEEMKTTTSVCTSNTLGLRMRGKILLQVQEHGEAWYIDPRKCKRIYMKDGDAAYQIMRLLGVGIADTDLEKIPTAQ